MWVIAVLSHQIWGGIKQQSMTILIQIFDKGMLSQEKPKNAGLALDV